MADLTVTAAQVGMVDPSKASVKSYKAGATITKGQAIAVGTDKGVDPADASTGGGYLIQFRGIALNGGGAGQGIDVFQGGQGEGALLYGFDLSGVNVGDIIYLSNTAGALADAAGDVTVPVGRVECLNDNAGTKVLRVDVNWLEDWS